MNVWIISCLARPDSFYCIRHTKKTGTPRVLVGTLILGEFVVLSCGFIVSSENSAVMNLGKLSGLKGLVSHSSGRRRFKGDLTPDMISPPLGDFRHTMHVGRGGDVFGDTSFLSNHGGAGNNGDGDSITASEKSEGFFSRTLRHVRKTPERPQGSSRDLSPPPPPISPIIKNAISLPRLDVDSPNGCPVKVLFPSTPKTSEESTFSYGKSNIIPQCPVSQMPHNVTMTYVLQCFCETKPSAFGTTYLTFTCSQ